LKKGKKATGSSRKSKKPVQKRRTRALIPLISKKENNKELVGQACLGSDEVVVLLVVDTEAMPGQFGFAASDIGHGNGLMREVKMMVEQQGKECNDLMEWGDTETKVVHLIQLRGIDKVVLLKQDNQFFKKLVKSIGSQTKASVELVKVAEEEQV
jgi:hypothetical protein